MTCSYETERIAEGRDRLAHDPEVAGSNPVPATKESGPEQAKRPASASWRSFRFVNVVNERCSPSVVHTPSINGDGPMIAGSRPLGSKYRCGSRRDVGYQRFSTSALTSAAWLLST
jgi:hypothetical protein